MWPRLALGVLAQMPKGVPVATVAIGNAANAGLLAVRILSTSQPDLLQLMLLYQAGLLLLMSLFAYPCCVDRIVVFHRVLCLSDFRSHSPRVPSVQTARM